MGESRILLKINYFNVDPRISIRISLIELSLPITFVCFLLRAWVRKIYKRRLPWSKRSNTLKVCVQAQSRWNKFFSRTFHRLFDTNLTRSPEETRKERLKSNGDDCLLPYTTLVAICFLQYVKYSAQLYWLFTAVERSILLYGVMVRWWTLDNFLHNFKWHWFNEIDHIYLT